MTARQSVANYVMSDNILTSLEIKTNLALTWYDCILNIHNV